MLATLFKILGGLGGTAIVGLLLALRYYRNRSKAAEVASEQLEQAKDAIQHEDRDRIGRLEDLDAYRRARAAGLSPSEALKKAEERE